MGTIVRPAALSALQTDLNLNYINAYKSDHPVVYPELTTLLPSSKKTVTLAIADLLPEMREWLGDRVFHNPALFSQIIENKHYELSMEVDADDVDDDNIEGYIPTAAELGDRAAQHYDVLLAALLKAGTTTIGYDGQNYFDTDHPIDAIAGTGSQSNYASTGRALTAANWEFVVTEMAKWKAGRAGKVLKAVPNAVIVPRQLEATARRIFEPETVPTAAGTAVEQNIFRGAAKVIVFDELNDQATTWYAVDLRSRLKPFVRTLRKPAKFVMMNRPDDHMMFQNNKIQFGVDGRWGVGLATWFKAYKLVA